ncbi:MAG: BREX-6 system BrxE protein [Myxococcales bacterium]|nr:BREX-6 system BrxE protein [Myxococcales bacterium]
MNLPRATLDHVLCTQLLVAWAGESGEERRLGWWNSDLTSEFGGEDLFQRLLPLTWRWATLQGAREAARRVDAEQRARSHDADTLVTLFRFGFAVDERLDEHLRDLKNSGAAPTEALPGLKVLLDQPWDSSAFERWVATRGSVDAVATPAGRRIKSPPTAIDHLADRFVAALLPLGPTWPLPHVVR